MIYRLAYVLLEYLAELCGLNYPNQEQTWKLTAWIRGFTVLQYEVH